MKAKKETPTRISEYWMHCPKDMINDPFQSSEDSISKAALGAPTALALVTSLLLGQAAVQV